MMTGIVTAGEGLGTLLFPPLAALLVQTYEWRVSYLILGAIVLIVVATAAQFLKRDPSDKGQYVDGGSDAEQPEMELADPAFSLGEVVSTKQFWLVCSVLFSIGFCVLAIVVHIIPHATDSGISVSTAANILASIGGFGIVGRLVLGGVADRIGIKRVLVMGLILMSVSLLWLLQSGELWEFYLFAIIFGLSSGGISTLGSPLVAELFGLKSHGLIYGVSDLGFTSGVAMGPLVTGYIFDSTGVYTLAFLVCAGLGIVAIILTGTLTPTNKHGVSLG
jgi:MFS family permease